MLSSLKKTCRGTLRVVFGCGGDRDKEKRAEMGSAAKKWSDEIYITSDNPRNEDPAAICASIGCPRVIVDRREAIEKAIEQASRGDTIAILGRGHEPFQIIGTQRIPFDDRIVAKDACANHANLLN